MPVSANKSLKKLILLDVWSILLLEVPRIRLTLLDKVITPAKRIFSNFLCVLKSESIETDNGKYANFFAVEKLSKIGVKIVLYLQHILEKSTKKQ